MAKKNKMLKRIPLGNDEYVIRVVDTNTIADLAYSNILLRIDRPTDIDLGGYDFGCINISKNVVEIVPDLKENDLMILLDKDFFISKNMDTLFIDIYKYATKLFTNSNLNIKIGLSNCPNDYIRNYYLCDVDTNSSVDEITTSFIELGEILLSANFMRTDTAAKYIIGSPHLSNPITQSTPLTVEKHPDMPKDMVTEKVLIITSTNKSGDNMVVDVSLIDEDIDTSEYVEKDKLFKVEDELVLQMRKIIRYTITEFRSKFKTDAEVVDDVEKYLNEFIDKGITYETVLVTISYIENIMSKGNNDSKIRAIKKKLRPVVNELNTIRIKYLVYPDDYSRLKQKEHERSGHWRKYRNGKTIWINTYKAGSRIIEVEKEDVAC